MHYDGFHTVHSWMSDLQSMQTPGE